MITAITKLKYDLDMLGLTKVNQSIMVYHMGVFFVVQLI